MDIIWQDIKALYKRSWRKLKLLRREDKAGLYITVIFHLTVIIVLAITQISTYVLDEKSFLFDFSRQEAEEARLEEEAFKEDISRLLDEMIRTAEIPVTETDVRNIAVDAGMTLKDDRGTDAGQLYKDAERITEEMGRKQAIEEDAREEVVDMDDTPEKSGKENEYKGPSVVSYKLEGRKASHLKIPAYRCMGGGEVTVIITVDNAGNVTNAKVLDAVSASDKCLREFAVRAARLSKFSKNPSASPKQTGEIVYRFIAQ